MEEYRDRSLDLFLDLAFDAEKGLPQDKPSCASFLYKWLGIIESCRQVGGGLILGEPWPQQAVQTVLADIDLVRTWTLVGNIRQALLNVVFYILFPAMSYISITPLSILLAIMVNIPVVGFGYRLMSSAFAVPTSLVTTSLITLLPPVICVTSFLSSSICFY